jgi:hypothetical protein
MEDNKKSSPMSYSPSPAAPGPAGRSTASATGLTLGTCIHTTDGTLPIEYLLPGDRVITRDVGAVSLLALDHRQAVLTPVLVPAGALGFDRPGEMVQMLPDQIILIRDWRAQALFGVRQAHVPVRRLIDGQAIRWDSSPRRLDIFTLRFARPHVVYADGVEVLCPVPLNVPSRVTG